MSKVLIDNSLAFTTSGSPSNHSFANDGELLLVGLGENGSGAQAISGITFDGDSMTQLEGDGSTQPSVYIYYLLNPSKTTANIVVSQSTVNTRYCFAISLKNVNLTNPFVSSDIDTGTSTTAAITPTGETQGCITIDMVSALLATTPNSGQTSIMALNSNKQRAGYLYDAIAGNMEYTLSSTLWCMACVTVRPGGGGGVIWL